MKCLAQEHNTNVPGQELNPDSTSQKATALLIVQAINSLTHLVQQATG